VLLDFTCAAAASQAHSLALLEQAVDDVLASPGEMSARTKD
jgi:hypothetical protein